MSQIINDSTDPTVVLPQEETHLTIEVGEHTIQVLRPDEGHSSHKDGVWY